MASGRTATRLERAALSSVLSVIIACLLGAFFTTSATKLALAGGGNGGSTGSPTGGTGGIGGANGQPGSPGGSDTSLSGGGGGGGGGGPDAGQGGTGGSGGGGALGGAPGERGTNTIAARGAGGGGGGNGGENGFVATGSFNNGASLGGGKGNRGGVGGNTTGAASAGGGGGGGSGGDGLVVRGASITNTSTITGGDGGAGGKGGNVANSSFLVGGGGNGGDGGNGIEFNSSGATLTNSGTVEGGHGGTAGARGTGGSSGGPAARVGLGGVGVVGAGLTIINSGTIAGGAANGGKGAQASAIIFTGGSNVLALRAGSTITGSVIGAGTDTFRLGGSTDSSFAVSKIGPTKQYKGFDTFIKTGTSTWTLTGANSTLTPWTISAGILQVTNNTSLGSAAGTVKLHGGTFQAGAAALAVKNPFDINSSGGTIDTQTYKLTLSGKIDGGGALTKTGSATLVLSGTDTYTGGTTINAGTLKIGDGGTAGSIRGDVTNNGVLAFDRSNSLIFDHMISGTGSVRQSGNGTTIFTGNNAYTGGTTISNGALQIGDGGSLGAITGNVVDNSTLALKLSSAISLFGVISGSGVLQQNGAGAVTLAGANSYAAGTNLNAGTLVVGNDSALGKGPLSMTAGTTLSFLNTGNFTIANNITVAGDPIFNAPSGTTQTIAGLIANGVSRGTLEMDGGGTLVLSATNTYTGATNVISGALDVTGSIASSSIVNVANGATLTGTGTVGRTRINSGAIFAPGTPDIAGTATTISGNLAFQSGALYVVNLKSTGATFANVSGTASLAGTANIVFASDSFLTEQPHTILQSAGLDGTKFSGLSTINLPADLRASLVYTPTDVMLDLIGALPTTGLNINQSNVATSLNNIFANGAELPPGFSSVFRLTGSDLANALTQMDGETAIGSEFAAFQLMNQFLNLMLDPFVDGRLGSGVGGVSGHAMGFAPDEQANLPSEIALAYAGVLKAPPPMPLEQRWTAWGASYGGGNWTSGNAAVGSSNITTQTFGFAAGMDYHHSPDTIFGFALGGGGTNWDLSGGGTGSSDAFQAGVYAMTRSGPAYLAAALAFANHWMTTNRAVLGNPLSANFDAQSYGARAEGGYRFALLPNLGVTPYAGLQAQDFHTPGYSESDPMGSGFGLSYASMNATNVRSELGARFDNPEVIGGMPLLLRARVAWAHDWVSNPAMSAVFESLPGSNFVVNGAPLPSNSALTSAGAELFITPRLTLLAKFDGEFAPGSQTYAGSGTLRYVW